MSSIDVTFTVQQNPGTTRGTVTVYYTIDGLTLALPLNLVQQRTSTGQFTEVTYVDGVTDSEAQALNYARAFNADYRYLGSNQLTSEGGSFDSTRNDTESQLLAFADGNTVTISGSGTFGSVVYSGDVLLINEVLDNQPEPDPEVFTVTETGAGNCSTMELSFTASGGTPPYTIYRGTSIVHSGWNGAAHTQSFARNGYWTYKVLDTNSNQIAQSESVFHPRPLAAGDFKIFKTNFLTYSDIRIEWVNQIAGVTPLQYSLDNSSWQAQNTFTGLLAGSYTLYVRDKYNCAVSKGFEILQVETQDIEAEPYFELNNLNGIKYIEYQDFTNRTKKNYYNALSHKEIGRIAYPITQQWDEEDLIWTQFKSSYPYHNITLLEPDGSKTALQLIKIQDNIGFEEKVDCWTFPIEGKTGVYFDGGNEYQYGTTTVIGASEYTSLPPIWAKVGQLVELPGIGTVNIDDDVKYDEGINRFYFTIPVTSTDTVATTIQTIYNKQPYNTYEFVFQVAQVADNARLIIEGGNNNNEIAVCYISEVQERILDNEEYLFLEWNDDLNKGGMVFKSGITPFMRIKGLFQPQVISESEISDGDDQSYSLYQDARLEYRLVLEGLNTQLMDTINTASGLTNFKVNGVHLIKKTQTAERYDAINLGTLEIIFALGGNHLGIDEDEITLQPTTGLLNGGGAGAKPSDIDDYVHDEKNRLILAGVTFLLINGQSVAIEDI